MLLKSRSGDSLDLSLAGYELGAPAPGSANGWDANWLVVSGHVTAGAETWAFVHPCLTTWEARELAGWLQRATHSRPEPIEFTEPNLSFRAGPSGGGGRDIAITLRGESAPARCSDDVRWGAGFTVKLHVAADALADAAQAWRKGVEAHPER